MKYDVSFDANSVFELSQNSSYAKLLGMKVLEVSEGRAKISMKLTEELLNPLNSPHGGAIFSLADHAGGTAALTLGPCVGTQTSANFIASPETGEVIVAEARVVHNGRKTRIVEVEVKDKDGRLLVKGTAVAIVLE
ncbi:MAG: PaaI family thioesterase [Pseudomonadota bacterium]